MCAGRCALHDRCNKACASQPGWYEAAGVHTHAHTRAHTHAHTRNCSRTHATCDIAQHAAAAKSHRATRAPAPLWPAMTDLELDAELLQDRRDHRLHLRECKRQADTPAPTCAYARARSRLRPDVRACARAWTCARECVIARACATVCAHLRARSPNGIHELRASSAAVATLVAQRSSAHCPWATRRRGRACGPRAAGAAFISLHTHTHTHTH